MKMDGGFAAWQAASHLTDFLLRDNNSPIIPMSLHGQALQGLTVAH
jgi:hypothetical protein